MNKYRLNIKGNKREYKAGRPNMPIYVYDENYKYLYAFATKKDCEDYYGLKPGDLFQGHPYRLMEDGHYIAPTKLGRNGLMRAINIRNCKFCKKLSNDKPIEIFNKLGEKLGEFRSFRELQEITNLNPHTLYSEYMNDINGRKPQIRRPLIFKLKENVL